MGLAGAFSNIRSYESMVSLLSKSGEQHAILVTSKTGYRVESSSTNTEMADCPREKTNGGGSVGIRSPEKQN